MGETPSIHFNLTIASSALLCWVERAELVAKSDTERKASFKACKTRGVSGTRDRRVA